jgi:hypothetical protein
MSDFRNSAFDPKLTSFSPKILGEFISNLSTSKRSIASLNDRPFGADRFKTGLTFLGCTTAIKGFTRNCLTGGRSNRPATNPLMTQSASVSVIHQPCWIAERAFFLPRSLANILRILLDLFPEPVSKLSLPYFFSPKSRQTNIFAHTFSDFLH